MNHSGMPTNILEEEALRWCVSKDPVSGSRVVTTEDFMQRPLLMAAINEGLVRANLKATANPLAAMNEGLERANLKATENAPMVQKFALLPLDLSIQGGEEGPMFKLKRQFIATKYQHLIEGMYDAQYWIPDIVRQGIPTDASESSAIIMLCYETDLSLAVQSESDL